MVSIYGMLGVGGSVCKTHAHYKIYDFYRQFKIVYKDDRIVSNSLIVILLNIVLQKILPAILPTV